MNEIPHPGFDKPEEYETFTTTNDLEEAAKEFAKDAYPDKHNLVWMFKRGSKWQKEQMLKEAVEAMVTTNLANRPVIYLDQLKGFQYGDKVRIVVVKEDEK